MIKLTKASIMFSGIRKILGAIKVVQTDREIQISGIPADVMTRDIAKVWKTSRINAHMFTKASNSSLHFPLFFAPDVLYILETMTTHRSRYTAVRTLTKIKELLLEETWLRDTQLEPASRVDLSKLNNMIYRPLDYQQQFFETYDRLVQQYQLKGYLLAASAGSGKTFINLALAECLGADRIVIICPKNATERVWESEIQKLFKTPQTYWIEQHGKPYKGERIVVAHYEALGKVLAIADRIRTERVFVALDESHNLNEISSQRTLLFLDLIKSLNARDVIFASGTPLKALGSEVIPMLRAIDPFFTPEIEPRFKAIFGRDGLRGLDILKHRIGLLAYKVEKHQLGLDKPVIRQLPVKVPNGKDFTLTAIRKDMAEFIAERVKYYASRRKEDERFYYQCTEYHANTLRSKPEQQAYKQYVGYVKILPNADMRDPSFRPIVTFCNQYELKKIIPSLPKEWRNDFKSVRSVIKYVQLKIQGEALGRVLGRKRIECHVAMVPYVDFKGICESTPKKTVVFTSFVEALEASNVHLKTNGMNPLVVYGKTNSELANTVKLFERQEDLNPLIATYHSLSTAVPLVMADTMIMLNSPFRAYIHEQAISRIHRLGADTQTTVYEAKLDTGDEPNISTRSGDILQWSQDQVSAIMGIKSPFDYEDLPAMEDLSLEELVLNDHQYVQDALADMLAPFGLTVATEDFDLVQACESITPNYLDW